MELPIGLGDRGGVHQRVERQRRGGFPAPRGGDPFPHPGGIDAGVDDEVGDVDVLRRELAGHRLGERAQPGLGRRESRIALAPAQRGGGAGEEDRAAAVRQHAPSRLPPGKEAGEAGHLPHLAEHPLRRVEERELNVGADVEDDQLERGVGIGGGEEAGDVGLVAGIQRMAGEGAARGRNLLAERHQLVALTTPTMHPVASASKAPGDGGPDEIAGAHDGDAGAAIRHLSSPRSLAPPVTPCGALSRRRAWPGVSARVQRSCARVRRGRCGPAASSSR
jgi:hypothetical protein